MRCMYCKEEIKYVKRKGWFHIKLKSRYVKKCKKCGYIGEDVELCPNCNSKRYVDDHIAYPDWVENEKEKDNYEE